MLGPHRLPCETPEAHHPCEPGGAGRYVLPATILGSSLSFIDGSVVNVALPTIQRSLGAPLATVQWVVNGYLLMLAGLILLGGAAGDRFGRRRVFLIGLAGFAVASLGCGLAPSAGWLIGTRLVQGTAAALVAPVSLAIIGVAYSAEARGRAIGTWAAAGALTTALGPPLGGWLVDTVGWRSIFFVNLPIAASALLLALKLPADGKKSNEPLDPWGAILAVLALGLLSYGLIALGEGKGLKGAAAVAAAVPAIWAFIRTEARTPEPMMPAWLFGNRDFAGANGLTVLLYAALGGALFVLPFVLIETHGYSASAAGAAFLPFPAIMGVGSRRSGALVERFGPRPPLVLGPSIAAAGYALLGVSGEDPSYLSGVLPGLVVVAIGMTLSIAPLTTTVFESAPRDRSGVASGINNTAARAGGLVAVAAVGLAFGGSNATASYPSAAAEAYRLVMFSAAGLAALGALVAALTIGRTASQDHQPGGR